MSPLLQLPDFLSQAEARQQIQFSEQLGYQTALVRTVSGQQHLPAIRQNQRLELANPDLSQQLFHRLQQRTRTMAHAQALSDAVAIAEGIASVRLEPPPTTLAEAKALIKQNLDRASHVWITGTAALELLDAAIQAGEGA